MYINIYIFIRGGRRVGAGGAGVGDDHRRPPLLQHIYICI